MGYDLVWIEEDLEDAANEYNYRLANDLEKALKEKQKQIKWKKNRAELSQRFHNMFGLGDLTLAEIWFESQSQTFRALCPVIEKAVFYYQTVPKSGSSQKRALKLMKKNSSEIKNHFQKRTD